MFAELRMNIRYLSNFVVFYNHLIVFFHLLSHLSTNFNSSIREGHLTIDTVLVGAKVS